MRRAFFLVAFLAMVLSTVGLLAGGQQDSKSPGVKKTEVTITTWNLLDGSWKDFYANDFAAFEAANPMYKMSQLIVPYEQYWDKVVTLVASGSPPDVIGENNVFLPVFITADQLEPLNKYVDAELIRKEYFPTEVNIKNGNYYGLPFGGRTMQLLYNKRLFSDYGVRVPTTHDELVDVARKLTDKSQGRFGYGLQTNVSNYDDTYECLEMLVRSFNGSFAKNGQPQATDSRTIQGVKFYKKLFDMGVAPVNVPKATLRELFYAEKMGMLIDGPWMPVFFDRENPAAKGSVDAAQNPWENKAAPGGVRYFFAIPKNAANKEGAGAYLKWSTAQQWHRTIVNVSGVPGGRKDSITPELLNEKPFLKVYLEGMAKYAFSEAPQGFESKAIVFMKEVVNTLGEMIYDKHDIETSLQDLQGRLLELKKEM